MATRVLIADDHRLFREGLKGLIAGEEFVVVAEAEDGQEAIRLAQRHQPDLALLDVMMPGLNGVDATREVLRVSRHSRVIVLTMHKESPYVINSLRAGARGYVVKTQTAVEMLAAMRAVARGDVYVPPDLSRALVECHQQGGDPGADPLSARERQVLQLVAEGHTTKAIGGLLHISFKTVETHRGAVMRKLDIHDAASLVRYAIRRGLIEA
ncbi:MAG: response regulator transcription factor [Candidatus Eisenbacteria bacterium]|nr:response regulator transcription factor [Candidatus Eisenbacteria bacterium]